MSLPLYLWGGAPFQATCFEGEHLFPDWLLRDIFLPSGCTDHSITYLRVSIQVLDCGEKNFLAGGKGGKNLLRSHSIHHHNGHPQSCVMWGNLPSCCQGGQFLPGCNLRTGSSSAPTRQSPDTLYSKHLLQGNLLVETTCFQTTSVHLYVFVGALVCMSMCL